jgi:hypothetical protein
MTQAITTRQRRPGQRLNECGGGPAGGKQGSLAIGPGTQAVGPAQEPRDGLGVTPVAERGPDMIEEAGPEAARADGLPSERVDPRASQAVAGRGGQARVDPADWRGWY